MTCAQPRPIVVMGCSSLAGLTLRIYNRPDLHARRGSMKDVLYLDEAATEYDRAFAHVSEHFLPFLLRAAHLSPGARVLDVATGTGLAAQAALDLVGPNGSVAATDVSPAMVEQA